MNFHPYDYYGHGGPDFPPNDLGFHMDEPLLGPPIPPQPSAQVPHDPLDARPGEHSWLYGHPQPIYRHAGPVLKPRRAPLPPPYAGYKDYDAYESVPINFERQQQMQRAADRPLSYRNLGNSFAVPKGSRTAMHRISAMATTARDPAHLHPAGKRLMDAAKAGGVQIGRAPVTVHVTSANGAASGRPERERERHDDAHGGGRNASVKAEQKSSQGSTRTETPPGKPNSAAAAAAPSNGPPKAPTPATQYPLSVPTTWKRTFESTRVRCPQESGVVAPVVELASQMLNSRCAQVIPVLGGGTRQKFTMVIDSTILKRGVLSSRSDDGMTLAMYLFKMGRGTNTGELVSADLMLGKMVVWVNDMRLLRSNTTTDGVQIDLLPALSPETLDRKTVKITIEADPYEFGSGFAMLCLRRLDPQLVRAADGLSAEPSLLRRHSAPGPPYPTPALGAIKRSTSTFSPSPSISVAEPPTISEKRPRQGSSENEEEDDGIEIGDQIVSLICPIVMRKIGIPGKGRGCRHVQCFDLEAFTKLSRLSPKWKCAVCNEVIEKSDLTVSEPFLHYLAAYPTADRCIVCADGSHAPYVESVRGSSQGRKKARKEIEVVDLCGSDEEAENEGEKQGQEGDSEKRGEKGGAEKQTPQIEITMISDDEEDEEEDEVPAPAGGETGREQPTHSTQPPPHEDDDDPPILFWTDKLGSHPRPADIAPSAEPDSHTATLPQPDEQREQEQKRTRTPDPTQMTSEQRAELIQRMFTGAAGGGA